MIKHIITMDKDDFESLKVSIHQLRYHVNKLETSYRQGEILRYIEEIEETLGIEPPPISEAVTAKWKTWGINQMSRSMILYCSNCNHQEQVFMDDGKSIPSVCPNCKAVMIGVE